MRLRGLSWNVGMLLTGANNEMKIRMDVILYGLLLFAITFCGGYIAYEEQNSTFQTIHNVGVEKCGHDNFSIEIVNVVHIPFITKEHSPNYVCKCNPNMTWAEAVSWGYSSGFYEAVSKNQKDRYYKMNSPPTK